MYHEAEALVAAGIVQLHSSESPVGPRALPPLVWWFSFPCLRRQVMRGWSPLPVSSDLRWEKEGGMARAATVPPIRKSDALPKALGRRLLLSHWPEWCHVTTPSCKGGQERGHFAFPASVVEEDKGDGLEMGVG